MYVDRLRHMLLLSCFAFSARHPSLADCLAHLINVADLFAGPRNMLRPLDQVLLQSRIVRLSLH